MDDKTFQQALDEARPRLDALHMQVMATLDQVLAAWRDIEPSLRAWVAIADQISEEGWRDESEQAHDFYVSMKAALVEIDRAKEA